MKKIWLMLLLLLLLIICCVWSKKDTIRFSSSTGSSSMQASVLMDDKRYVEYTIKQKNGAFTLNGNFKNVQQQQRFAKTIASSGGKLIIENTSTNHTLAGDDIIELTDTILPHFIANYTEGKINYRNEKLTVSGNVKGYKAKNEMQRLLNQTSMATVNDTNVVLVKPIDFAIQKSGRNIQLSGTFKNKKQVNTLSQHLRPSYSTLNLRQNAQRIDKGAIPVTQKILPSFLKNYKSGQIVYTNGTLVVEGMVNSQEALDEISTLLSKSKIPVKNLSIIDPEILQKAKEAEAAALTKAKAEAAAKEQAEKEAQRRAEEEAKKAQEVAAAKRAKEEAEAKARLEALRAKQEQERLAAQRIKEAQKAATAVKEKITKLLKIENIAFEVGKENLTSKGESTVDKLANILNQYPHIKTEIAGHTDSDGSAEFNQKLSQSRVDMVKARLISKGIKAERLTAKGYGESRPLVPNTSDENKQKNRRVEINIQGE